VKPGVRVKKEMDTVSVKQFNAQFNEFIDYLKNALPAHKNIHEMEKSLKMSNYLDETTAYLFFKRQVLGPYKHKIYKCDVSVVDDVSSMPNTLLDIASLWNDPSLDEMKKAEIFRHLITLCQICDTA